MRRAYYHHRVVGVLAGVLATLIFHAGVVCADGGWQATSLPATTVASQILIVEARLASRADAGTGTCNLLYSVRDMQSRISVFRLSGDGRKLVVQGRGLVQVDGASDWLVEVEHGDGQLPCSNRSVVGRGGDATVVVYYSYIP